MLMKKMVLSSVFLFFVFVGCGKVGVLECGDEMILDLVCSIIQWELGVVSVVVNLSVEQFCSVFFIFLVYLMSFDEKISCYSCEVDLVVLFNNFGQDVYKLWFEYIFQVVNG